jgi:uncharacterized membrane protein
MWHAGWAYWAWGTWFWIVCMAVTLALIWAIPWSRRSRNIPPEEQILRERYARGEITAEEFRQRLQELRHAT